MSKTVPLGAVMTTVIAMTLVFVLGIEIVARIGVIPGAKCMMTDGFVIVKLTPEDPG